MYTTEIKTRKTNDSVMKACVISAYTYIVDHINYGSLLQYYALQTVLESEKVDAYWLRFVQPYENKLKNIIKSLVKFCLSPKRILCEKKALMNFDEFVKNYLKVSKLQYNSEEDLENSYPDADIYITGSDQVWGGILKPNYLCFVPEDRLKISYAASFGKKQIPEEQLERIMPWVRRLNKVSVREYSGIKICKIMGIHAKQVLDPTLLLTKEQYPQKGTIREKYGDYILGYFLNFTIEKEEFPVKQINQFVDLKQTPLIITATEQKMRMTDLKYTKEYMSPEEWLGAYADAETIFTNTFHGTVFALIFHKPFLVFLQKGQSSKQNERLFSLLELVHMEDRIYINNTQIEKQINAPINWERYEQIISEHRGNSLNFLRQAIGEERNVRNER